MRRLGGWWWVGGGIAFIALIAIAGIVWFQSDADLRRAQAAGRSAGVATTWEEAGFVAMSTTERASFDRLTAVARKLPSLTVKDASQSPRPGNAPSPALIAFHAGIATEDWKEVDAALDGLPAKPSPLFERFTYSTKLEYTGESRDLLRLLAERIALCQIDDLPRRIEQASRLCHLVESQTLIQELVDCSCASILASAVTTRRGDLRGTDHGRSVSVSLRELRSRLWNARCETWRGEGMVQFTTYADIAALSSLTGASGSTPGSAWEDAVEWSRSLCRPLVYRLNRETALMDLISVETAVNGAVDGPDLLHRLAALSPPQARMAWLADFSRTNPFPIASAHQFINSGLIKTALTLDVIASDLVGDPLPPDAFSPILAPLRPVERNGQLIGWYSVGPNGVDDGGMNGKDHGIPLVDAFGSSHFSDPPRPRP